MLSKEFRKEAIRKFKEQKPGVGIYAVRCTATGQAWVGISRNLEAERNSCWFRLRNKLHQEKSLQQQWDDNGEPAFEYEIVDRIDPDVHLLQINDLLKKKEGRLERSIGCATASLRLIAHRAGLQGLCAKSE
jgi:hypothetical protein